MVLERISPGVADHHLNECCKSNYPVKWSIHVHASRCLVHWQAWTFNTATVRHTKDEFLLFHPCEPCGFGTPNASKDGVLTVVWHKSAWPASMPRRPPQNANLVLINENSEFVLMGDFCAELANQRKKHPRRRKPRRRNSLSSLSLQLLVGPPELRRQRREERWW